MRDFRHPAAEPVYWCVTLHRAPVKGLAVYTRLAIEAKDAAKLFLVREGIAYDVLEALQVAELEQKPRTGKIIDRRAEVLQ